jgi:prepilin-type N-terminal cleavage/methylation domain-containing protein
MRDYMKFKNLKNKKGFTVTEVLISVGLLSIVSLAVMSIWTNILETQKSVYVLQDISSFETRLKKLMADETICKNNFGGKIMPAVATPSSPNSMTVDRVQTAAGGEIVYDRNVKKTEGKAEITSIKLVNQYFFATTKAVGTLELDFIDKSNRKFKRSLPIVFLLEGGNVIKTCSSSSVIIESATIRTACEVVSEGTMRYNETLKKCEPYPTVDFVGSTFEAYCGAGYRVISCGHTPSAYVEPLVNITFKNGGVQQRSLGEFNYTVNRGPNSCDCDYTQAMLSADPGVQCIAKCTEASQ